jgi:hypothetical protein
MKKKENQESKKREIEDSALILARHPFTHHLSLFPNRRRLLAFAAPEVI